MDNLFSSPTDQELRIWCAEQCRNNNGELNLEKAKELYKFITSHKEEA
jgi:hypothetical protein